MKERDSILSNILKIRDMKGYSQENVANFLGIKQAGYGLIENGKRGLSYDVLLQIAIFFDMDVVDVITFPSKYVDVKCTQETKNGDHTTKVMVEFDVSDDEFVKMGLKNKIIQVLNK